MAHGVVLIDKPAGMSSARALNPLKTGRRAKVGHAGTLDPFATGLLIALLGDATRLSDLAMRLPKQYTATVLFGAETDTLDKEGKVVAEADPGTAAPATLAETVARFVGEQDQTPPAYSAKKIDGRRAYKLARSGEAREPAPRRVVAYRVTITDVAWPRVTLDLECGAGYYVRSLARDIGRALDLPAHLEALRRTRIGPFDVAAADPERVHGCRALVDAAGLPTVELSADDGLAFVVGLPVAASGLAVADRIAVLEAGRVIGLGHCEREGTLRPSSVFSEERRRLEGRA